MRHIRAGKYCLGIPFSTSHLSVGLSACLFQRLFRLRNVVGTKTVSANVCYSWTNAHTTSRQLQLVMPNLTCAHASHICIEAIT